MAKETEQEQADREAAAAEARAEHALGAGRFAANDREDNTVDTNNPAYVGVDDIYKTRGALGADDPDVQAAHENEEERRVEAHEIGFQGYKTDKTPASERVKPVDKYVRGTQAVVEALAADAEERNAARAATDEKPAADTPETTETAAPVKTPAKS